MENEMRNKSLKFVSLMVLVSIMLSACSVAPAISDQLSSTVKDEVNRLVQEKLDQVLPMAEVNENTNEPASEQAPAAPVDPSLLAAYERMLTEIYDFVNPSAINIRIVPAQALLLAVRKSRKSPVSPTLKSLDSQICRTMVVYRSARDLALALFGMSKAIS
jgi:hypothetical protein